MKPSRAVISLSTWLAMAAWRGVKGDPPAGPLPFVWGPSPLTEGDGVAPCSHSIHCKESTTGRSVNWAMFRP